MPGTALLEVSKALYTKLTGDATLMALIQGVFDAAGVPNSQAFPYVTIGDFTEVMDDTHDRTGKEDTITLHIWSRYQGKKEALEILDRINVILEWASMTITGYTLTMMKYDNAETVVMDEGKIVHVPARYRIITQQT